MVKIILIKSPDEWTTTKQACRDQLAVYLSFSSHDIYIYIYIYIHIYVIYYYISTALMRPRRPKQYCLQLVIYIYIYIKCKILTFINRAQYIGIERCIYCGRKKTNELQVQSLQTCFLVAQYKYI